VAIWPITSRRGGRLVRYLADYVGVSEERFRATLKMRKLAKRAAYYRKYKRRYRTGERRTRAVKSHFERKYAYAPMSEFWGLMQTARLTIKEFCALAGISTTSFYNWYGFPMHKWPIELLRAHIWSRNMSEYLLKKGVDTAQFKATLPPLSAPGSRALTERGVPKIAGMDKEE